ncbi:uncharacterized protein LOC144665745 isoform X2 [Oculina patagonica]
MAYRASSLRGLAVAQMVFGALMIVFGVASVFAVGHWSSYVGFGIWVGIWVLISGILGYIGAKDNFTPNKCLIGCFMGFSITACVIAGVMFICYCFAVADFARILRCRSKYYDYNQHPSYDSYYNYKYCYSYSKREMAANGAGLGSCLLIFSMVEFFLAIASSIYCCAAVCCSTLSGAVGTTVTNQQVMYVQPQHMYPGAQGGMIIVQPSGAVTTMPQGYPVAGQQQVYIPQQPVPMQQPAYWAVPSGSTPSGVVTVPYAGAAATQMQNQGQPPPYSFTQTGNAPPALASSSGGTPSEALAADV